MKLLLSITLISLSSLAFSRMPYVILDGKKGSEQHSRSEQPEYECRKAVSKKEFMNKIKDGKALLYGERVIGGSVDTNDKEIRYETVIEGKKRLIEALVAYNNLVGGLIGELSYSIDGKRIRIKCLVKLKHR